MDEFKLIAIRPLARCHKTYLRVLKIKRSYVFYNQYDFSGYTDKNKTIKIVKNNIPDLYSFKNSEGKDIKISVSAVVGQNGSGKSSLVELFYVACYNLAISKGVLIDEETDIRLTEKHMMKGVNVEIFYHSGEEIRMLQFIGSKINHFELKNELFLQSNTELNLNSFFYTISINYSLHALNSKVIGDWVKMIFKKNDGYQTPIVLNPYRSEGNIEVNNEEYLIKSRLISNILGKISKKNPPSESLRNIIDDKLAYKLHINLRTEKFKYGKDKKPRFDLTKAHGDKLLPTVYKHFLKMLNSYRKIPYSIDMPRNTLLVN